MLPLWRRKGNLHHLECPSATYTRYNLQWLHCYQLAWRLGQSLFLFPLLFVLISQPVFIAESFPYTHNLFLLSCRLGDPVQKSRTVGTMRRLPLMDTKATPVQQVRLFRLVCIGFLPDLCFCIVLMFLCQYYYQFLIIFL